MVESDRGTRLLLDTPPELRMQLIAAAIDRVDAVFFTHDHADHTHGLDDLRAITMRRDGPISMYGPADSLERLARRFGYIFDPAIRALPGTSKPEAVSHALAPGETVAIGDVQVTAVALPHGPATVFGYRIGNLGYITDAQAVPDSAMEAFHGVTVLVLNALFRTEHPTHLSLPGAISVARAIGAERTYLTHLTHDNMHADLEAELPRGIAPAFDGLTVRVD
ncbi:MAG TPA: MBL fold metallo-hydrolase [Gemmatimonadaceae bacterium]|nr:MBL fold metallo-hydrolase [Gemmatimonadaceae bacterium]